MSKVLLYRQLKNVSNHARQVHEALRAPNIGGQSNWFCSKTMLPFGSHQAPVREVERPSPPTYE